MALSTYMQFGVIKRPRREISLEEWNRVIRDHPMLQQLPARTGINPFTREPMVFSGEGKAYYIEAGVPRGNICLEGGELKTTGVPRPVCSEIALQLGARVHEDDRT
jgi:hypothetical protein